MGTPSMYGMPNCHDHELLSLFLKFSSHPSLLVASNKYVPNLEKLSASEYYTAHLQLKES